jgi:hypothetical protein
LKLAEDVPVVRIREFEHFDERLIAGDQAVSHGSVYELAQAGGLVLGDVGAVSLQGPAVPSQREERLAVMSGTWRKRAAVTRR